MGNWTLPEWRAQLAQAETRFDAYLLPILTELRLSKKDVALVGFSQGGVMALHFGIRREVCAVVSFSGVLVDSEGLKDCPVPPHILLVHGDTDPVIPSKAFFQAQEILRANSISFEALMRPNQGHCIDSEGLQRACDFLRDHLIS
jgi:phospholipase/carboxylesterase